MYLSLPIQDFYSLSQQCFVLLSVQELHIVKTIPNYFTYLNTKNGIF